MILLFSGPPGFACWISFAPVISFMYLSLFLLYLLLYLDFYVLGDDVWIS